jgi:hypothetical protein
VNRTQWVLAFDASCGKCRAISAVVAEASGGKLEVLPLLHPDVVQWRRRSLGEDAPFAPTFIRAGGDDVRAWTGASMTLPLLRRLGLRATIKVMDALGRLKEKETARLGRKQFLRLGAGAGVAAGIVLAGKAPAFADQGDEIQRWLTANQANLPTTYSEFTARPMAYRKAIYNRLPDDARQRLWLDQVRRYRQAHQDLSAGRVAVLEDFEAFVSRGFVASGEDFGGKDRMTDSILAEFGKDEGIALFATLGPVETDAFAPAGRECTCSTWEDLCSGAECRNRGDCDRSEHGCGWAWYQHCDGTCWT